MAFLLADCSSQATPPPGGGGFHLTWRGPGRAKQGQTVECSSALPYVHLMAASMLADSMCRAGPVPADQPPQV
eukprot:3808985-Rhodomonas_salina.1